MIHITALKVSSYKKTPVILQALDTMFCFLYDQYLELILEPLNPNMLTVRLNQTIDSFHEERAYHLFRFQKNDLKRLLKALRILSETQWWVGTVRFCVQQKGLIISIM
jgi:hypothetical protein